MALLDCLIEEIKQYTDEVIEAGLGKVTAADSVTIPEVRKIVFFLIVGVAAGVEPSGQLKKIVAGANFDELKFDW